MGWDIYRKYHEEERSEVVKHFREEIPPQAGVGREVGKGESGRY